MRIVGDISHPSLKITVFLHESRYSVKFESGLCEMTYKFRNNSTINSIEDIRAIIDASFINTVMESLDKMQQQKIAALSKWQKQQAEDEFEEII